MGASPVVHLDILSIKHDTVCSLIRSVLFFYCITLLPHAALISTTIKSVLKSSKCKIMAWEMQFPAIWEIFWQNFTLST